MMRLLLLFLLLTGSAWACSELCDGGPRESESPAVRRARIAYVNQLVDEIDCGQWSPNLIRAILWVESGWRQYEPNGETFISCADIGIAQLNINTILAHEDWDVWRCYYDAKYNIQCAVEVLNEKLDLVRYHKADRGRYERFHRLYGVLGEDELSLTILAYNGFQRSREYPNRVKEYWRSEPWKQYLKLKHHPKGELK